MRDDNDSKDDRGNEVVKEVLHAVGVLVFLAILMAFCWLCCVASGYHWE